MNITLRPDIFWVGYVDWSIRDFHGYDTACGTTYNAYLLRDERTALIDTVKQEHADTLLGNIAAVLGQQTGQSVSGGLDYLVVNHAELDHSGALSEVLRAYPGATVVCDAKCRAALAEHFDTAAWKFQVVKEGDRLCLGRRSLEFYETPMVHWPESMWTCVPEERLLFSMDVFGQHMASGPRFDDEMPREQVFDEAKTYFANILLPYPKAVLMSLDKLRGLEIDAIAPSHGVIWRSGVAEILAAYRDWATGRRAAKVVVLYDTMWESTRAMAEAILDGASQPGVHAVLISMRATSLTRIAAEVHDAAAVAVGCPTLNRGPTPAAAAVLSYLRGLKPSGKAAMAFGSYGWGPGGPETVQEGLAALGWEMAGPPLRAKYRPTADVLAACRAAGRRLAEAAQAKAAGATVFCSGIGY
ncbi:MAG: FprA family A-type flavoprotein [Thermoguttaceae bacterium]